MLYNHLINITETYIMGSLSLLEDIINNKGLPKVSRLIHGKGVFYLWPNSVCVYYFGMQVSGIKLSLTHGQENAWIWH